MISLFLNLQLLSSNSSPKVLTLKNILINNQNLAPVKELFSSKTKIRSSHLNFLEQTLTASETHFISEHTSFSLFLFYFKRLKVGSERRFLQSWS